MKAKEIVLAVATLISPLPPSVLHAASTLQFARPTTVTVPENAGEVELAVERSGDLDTVVTVDFTTADSTAKAGSDYQATAGTLTFEAGQTNRTIRVPILNDALPEALERFTVTLSNPSANATLGSRVTASVSVADNDPGVQVEFANYWADEGSETVTVGVSRGIEEDFPATVDYATADSTAKAGTDYEAVAGTLSFAADEKLKLVVIRVLNDGVKESTKTFRFAVSNPTGATALGTVKSATVTIKDNDPGVHLELDQYWVTEDDGALGVKVCRGNDMSLDPFSVDYATADLTAKAGEDYAAAQGTLAFGAGESERTITVPIWRNPLGTLDRRFKLTLSNPSAGSLGAPVAATVTVLDTTGIEEHQLSGIALKPDRSVQVALAGSVHQRFKPYFDLYPVEISSNLLDWVPLITLVRTNASTNALTFVDTAQAERRFYRTVARPLVTPAVQPTGPFPVGVTSRLITDPTRRNRYNVSSNGSFMISLWYPAVAKAGTLPSRFEDRALAEDPMWAPAWNAGSLRDREPNFVSHALPEPECATSAAPYPVILHSMGGWSARSEIAARGPEIASHGYVVVGIDHWDAFGTEFPDGTYLHGVTNATQMSENVTLPRFLDRVRDLRVVLETLEQWNQTDSRFAGRLDLAALATMGFSWGGGVAGEIARTDTRCKAAVILEGYFQNCDELLRVGLSKPTLSIYRSDTSDSRLFELVERDAVWFQITAITHEETCDYYWFSSTGRHPGLREAHRTMNVYIVWFLNKYLRGLDEPMPALKDHPRIFNFKQK